MTAIDHEEREAQIRQVEEEIAFVCAADYSGPDGEVSEKASAAQGRTIDRLQAALAELKKGMRV